MKKQINFFLRASCKGRQSGCQNIFILLKSREKYKWVRTQILRCLKDASVLFAQRKTRRTAILFTSLPFTFITDSG